MINLYGMNMRIVLWFLFIYAFVAFEASNSLLVYTTHIVALSFILLYALACNKFKFKLNKSGKLIILWLLIFTVISASRSLELGVFLFPFAIMFGSILASIIYNNTKFYNQFLITLKWFIIGSFLLFFLQFVVFQLMGITLHIHQVFFPFSEARIEIQENFNYLQRAGGLYIEPGTYSNSMYVLLVIYLILRKNIFDLVLLIGTISIILSFSVWGMVFGSYILIIMFFMKFKDYLLKKNFILILILISMGIYAINYSIDSPAVEYATLKMDSNSGSVSTKEQVFSKYQEDFFDFLVIGEGFKPKFQKGTEHMQDAGFLLNLSIVFGILFSIILLGIYIISFIKCCSLATLLISLPIFVGKLYYWDPSIWLLFFLVVYGANYKAKQTSDLASVLKQSQK